MNRACRCGVLPYRVDRLHVCAVGCHLNTTAWRGRRSAPGAPAPAAHSRPPRGFRRASGIRRWPQDPTKAAPAVVQNVAAASFAAGRGGVPRPRKKRRGPAAKRQATVRRPNGYVGPTTGRTKLSRPRALRCRSNGRRRPRLPASATANHAKGGTTARARRAEHGRLSSQLRRRKTGAPDRSRTCDLWLRKPTLYPTELRARSRTFYRGRRGGVQRCSAASVGHDIM